MANETPNNYGTLSLSLGVASFCCTLFTAIPAIILGVLAIRSGDATQRQRGIIGLCLGATITVLLMVGLILRPPDLDAPNAGLPAAANHAANVAMPSSEKSFCDAIAAARSAYGQGSNDLQKSRVARERASAVRAAVPGGTIQDWVGTIRTLTTNGDGKAVLIVELPCGTTVGTWNNAFSDIADNTLIAQSGSLYRTLESASTGAKVVFSATLIPDPERGFRESSLTEAGAVSAPAWIARIQDVRMAP
jgi:hypothetical protein